MQRKTLPSNGDMKKQIVRNCEVPLASVETKKRKDSQINDDGFRRSKHQPNKSGTLNHNSLQTPKLNFSAEIISQMNNLTLQPNIEIGNLTPKSKNIIAQEVTKKLNFPYDKPLYTDLISIQSDNENLKSTNDISSRRHLKDDKYLKHKKEIPVPQLEDYLSSPEDIEVDVLEFTLLNDNSYHKIDLKTDERMWETIKSIVIMRP